MAALRMATLLAFALLSGVALGAHKDVTQLQIGVKFRPDGCKEGTVEKAKNGDKLKIHYTGMLTNGDVFDSSVERGDPFSFTLGQGQVIKGWDQGVLGMCVGEKRRLKIPPHMGYGDSGSPPKIPGGATLVFDVELMGIEAPEPDYSGMGDMMGDYGGMGGMGDMADMMGGMGGGMGGDYGDEYGDY